MRRFVCVLLLGAACLPQVGPPVSDSGAGGGGSSATDGGAGGGGGGAANPGCPGYANCTSFTDGTTVTFNGGGDVYTPKCLRVRAGQSVTFTGDFTEHPLEPDCGPAQTTGWSFGQVTFTVPGIYGYYCIDHGSNGGSGMAGAIEVVP